MIAATLTLFAAENDGNEAAPSWVPALALAIPILIMLSAFVIAIRGRRRSKRSRAAQERGVKPHSVALDSAHEISDGGDYSVDALLRALSIAEEDWGPKDGMPHNEGAGAEALGLKAVIGDATEVLEPNIFWGSRRQGQVFVRVGPDEKIAGGTELYSNRHIRQLVTLRVETPAIVLAERGGRPTVVEGSAPQLDRVLKRLKPNRDVWQGFTARGGPEGIVTSRKAIDQPGFWVYDLWLVEMIARGAEFPALGETRIGPAWIIPYGVGRKSIDA